MRAERRPQVSETLLAHDFTALSGGEAANVAFLARHLGVAAILLAKVGDDAWTDADNQAVRAVIEAAPPATVLVVDYEVTLSIRRDTVRSDIVYQWQGRHRCYCRLERKSFALRLLPAATSGLRGSFSNKRRRSTQTGLEAQVKKRKEYVSRRCTQRVAAPGASQAAANVGFGPS